MASSGSHKRSSYTPTLSIRLSRYRKRELARRGTLPRLSSTSDVPLHALRTNGHLTFSAGLPVQPCRWDMRPDSAATDRPLYAYAGIWHAGHARLRCLSGLPGPECRLVGLYLPATHNRFALTMRAPCSMMYAAIVANAFNPRGAYDQTGHPFPADHAGQKPRLPALRAIAARKLSTA